MCYPPVDEIKEGFKLPENIRSLTGYRLPMEDEWECACRSGASTSRFFGNDEALLPRYGWFIKNSDGSTRPCGLLLPNDFGLFDILGNVREWCHDLYPGQAATQPRRDASSSPNLEILRVSRGGCFLDQARVLRDANRFPWDPNIDTYSIGFRIVRTAPKPK
jgi:formylglycine-generating enzyme required for sulfatase activity